MQRHSSNVAFSSVTYSITAIMSRVLRSLCHERRLYVKEISKPERAKHDRFSQAMEPGGAGGWEVEMVLTIWEARGVDDDI